MGLYFKAKKQEILKNSREHSNNPLEIEIYLLKRLASSVWPPEKHILFPVICKLLYFSSIFQKNI